MALTFYQSEDDLLVTEFRSLAENVACLLTNEKVRAIPYHESHLPHFSALSSEKKRQACHDIKCYLQSLEAVLAGNGSLRDKRSLWTALKFFGFTPTSDIFELINAEDAIEIYNAEGLQIWRNLGFMEVCSYSLEEVFCYTWQERYERHPEAMSKLVTILENMKTDRPPRTVRADVNNMLVEVFSMEKLIIDVHHEYMSPVMDSDRQMAGFVISSKVKVLRSSVSKESAIKQKLTLIPVDRQI